MQMKYSRAMISDSKVFRSIAETVVPEMSELDERGWNSAGTIIEHALSQRPAVMQRQLRLFIGALNFYAVLKHRSTLPALLPSLRTAFLEEIQASRILLIRRGFWGLRTLIFMGFYARPEAIPHVGYRAHPLGWQNR